eukprot:1421752-Amphidinium_carterae.4
MSFLWKCNVRPAFTRMHTCTSHSPICANPLPGFASHTPWRSTAWRSVTDDLSESLVACTQLVFHPPSPQTSQALRVVDDITLLRSSMSACLQYRTPHQSLNSIQDSAVP